MRGNAHVRFGGAGRGNGCSERTTPRPGPIPTPRLPGRLTSENGAAALLAAVPDRHIGDAAQRGTWLRECRRDADSAVAGVLGSALDGLEAGFAICPTGRWILLARPGVDEEPMSAALADADSGLKAQGHG